MIDSKYCTKEINGTLKDICCINLPNIKEHMINEIIEKLNRLIWIGAHYNDITIEHHDLELLIISNREVSGWYVSYLKGHVNNYLKRSL